MVSALEQKLTQLELEILECHSSCPQCEGNHQLCDNALHRKLTSAAVRVGDIRQYLNPRVWYVVHVSEGRSWTHLVKGQLCVHEPHAEGKDLVAYCPGSKTKIVWREEK